MNKEFLKFKTACESPEITDANVEVMFINLIVTSPDDINKIMDTLVMHRISIVKKLAATTVNVKSVLTEAFKEINAANVLLGNFIGVEYKESQNVFDGIQAPANYKKFLHPEKFWFAPHEVLFQESWDWFMPVWLKFQAWYLEHTKGGQIVPHNSPKKFRSMIMDAICKGDLLTAHTLLAEGITWFNSLKTDNKNT